MQDIVITHQSSLPPNPHNFKPFPEAGWLIRLLVTCGQAQKELMVVVTTHMLLKWFIKQYEIHL